MALTSAQIAKQTEVLAGVRAAFNAAVVPVAAALNALPKNDVLTSAIGAWNNIVTVMNAGNTAAIRAAIDATDAMIPTDPQFMGGYFDGIRPTGLCYGWAGKTGTVVHITVDGVLEGTATASLPRPDVQASNGLPNTGWEFQLPASVSPTSYHQVEASVGDFILGTGTRSYGSNPSTGGTGNTTFTRFVADLSSDAAIKRQFTHANVFYGTQPTVNNPTKWIDGMLEVPIIPPLNAGPGIGGTGCSWHWLIPQDPVPPDELWCEYDFYIDPDVVTNFNEEGCKLPGLAGAWEQPGEWAAGSDAYGWFSARLWHRRPDPAGNCELAGYVYSARSHDAGNPYGEITATGKMLQPGIKYKLGQHIKLNSQAPDGTWRSDGLFEILLDGEVVLSIPNFKMRADPRATFQEFFVNIFHGGSVPPKGPIHYRIGGIIVDNKPITRGPVIDLGRVPDWRRGAPIGQLIDIPGTAPASLGNLGAIFDGDYSGVYNDRVNACIYSAGASGHQVGAQNGVYGINLMVDAPRWATLRASNGDRTPGASDAYWPDGRPAGSHIYYSGQVPIINGKPVLVRAVGLATNYSNNPFAPQRTDAFHLDTNDWDLNGGDWDQPLQRATPGENAIALDRRANKIYRMDQQGLLAVLDCVTRKWRTINTDVFYGWGGCVIVPELDELVWDAGNYNGRGGTFLQGYNVTTGAMTQRNYTWEGTPKPSAVQWRSMLVQEALRAIWVLGDVGQLCRLDLATWKMKHVDSVPMPITPYNRIEDFPTLGGIVHMPAFASNLRFMATE